MKKQDFIISLGGSLIVPKKGIDWRFLKKFRELLIKQMKKGQRFIIITGGGNIARVYQDAADKIGGLTDDDKDWLGIHSTRMNAHLIKTIFRKYAHPRINKNPNTKEDLKEHFAKGEKIMVAAGWRPGWSTDYVAITLAERFGAKKVINLSNIDFVYDRDPKRYKTAKKIKEINWKNFRKIVGSKWEPGLNMPFDPMASKKSQELGLEVVIMNGKKFKNLERYLDGIKTTGTVIKN